MIHLQYYNSVIKNNHINKILNNYQIKYTQIKNEIDLKINQMMKLFLKDIFSFLENLEEVAEQKHKINEYNSIVKELELTKTKLKDKVTNENKLKNECEILQQENCLLKLKINSLNYKINNLINTNNNSQRSSPIRKKSNNSMTKRNNNSSKLQTFLSPRIESGRNLYNQPIELNNSYNNRSINSLLSQDKSENKKNKNIKTKENNEKLSLKLLKLNYDKDKKSKINLKSKKKKVNIKKFVHQNKLTKNNNNLKKYTKNKKEEDYTTKSRPNINKIIKRNKKINSSAEKTKTNGNHMNKYSPINTVSQSVDIPNINSRITDYENLGKNINNVIDCELKELEQDEANIELLLEQLINYNKK